jgi:hypothetical protein
MTIKAALLDAPAAGGMGVYVRMDELPDATALTERHVPAVIVCDLPAGKYRWVPDATGRNPFGGAFWPLNYLNRLAQDQIDVAAAEARVATRQLIVIERGSRR